MVYKSDDSEKVSGKLFYRDVNSYSPKTRAIMSLISGTHAVNEDKRLYSKQIMEYIRQLHDEKVTHNVLNGFDINGNVADIVATCNYFEKIVDTNWLLSQDALTVINKPKSKKAKKAKEEKSDLVEKSIYMNESDIKPVIEQVLARSDKYLSSPDRLTRENGSFMYDVILTNPKAYGDFEVFVSELTNKLEVYLKNKEYIQCKTPLEDKVLEDVISYEDPETLDDNAQTKTFFDSYGSEKSLDVDDSEESDIEAFFNKGMDEAFNGHPKTKETYSPFTVPKEVRFAYKLNPDFKMANEQLGNAELVSCVNKVVVEGYEILIGQEAGPEEVEESKETENNTPEQEEDGYF